MNSGTKRRNARAIWLPLLAWALFAGGAAAAIWSMRDELPAKVISHWGVDGKPDGWSTPTQSVLFLMGFTLLLAMVLVGLGILTKQRAIGAGIGVGLTVFLAGVVGGSTLMQHPSSPVHSVEIILFPGLVLALIVGVLAGIAVRKPPSQAVSTMKLPIEAPVLDVAPGARIAWTGRPRLARAGKWLLVCAGVVMMLMGLYFAIVMNNWGLGGFVITMGVLFGGLYGVMCPRIIVNADGIRAKTFGLTTMHIPLSQVEFAVVDPNVNPLADFGGWGFRFNMSGEGGFVTSKGPAMRIHRAEEPNFLITVAGADEAVRTVNTLVARRG